MNERRFGIRRLLRRAFGPRPRPDLRLVTEWPGADRVVHLTLASRWPPPHPGQLRVGDRVGLPRLQELVAYATRAQLPVSLWCVSGLEAVPMRPGQLARWLAVVAEAAAPTPVVVMVDRLAAEPRRRLIGHLQRQAALSADGAALSWGARRQP